MVNIPPSTAVYFGLSMAIIGLVLLLAYVMDTAIRAQAALTEEIEVSHDDCVAQMIEAVSDRYAAERLRALALAYDSPEEIRTMRAIQRTQWKESGPRLPALWLNHHADLIDPTVPNKPKDS